jgi:hypothetical protein
MARKSTAFRKGLILGGLAGVGYLLWNAPQPGWRTREQILEAVEGLLFRVLDIPERSRAARDQPISERTVPAPVPVATQPPADLPVDVVLDGPRPAEHSI